MTLLFAISMLAQADLIVLDNGAFRVEVDPQVFAVRFVGVPGGRNFVEPLLVDEAARLSADGVDAGGLCTDLIPFDPNDAALKRGPAEVLEQDRLHVALLGPVSKTRGVRLKKEIRLDEKRAAARYSVTAMATTDQPIKAAIRNTARVGPRNTLRVDRADATIRPLVGATRLEPAVVNSAKYWLIPVPPTAHMEGVVLGAFAPAVTHQNDSGTWTRRIVDMPQDADVVPLHCTLLCLLDDVTLSYAAALQGAALEVTRSAPAVFVEEWTFEKRGSRGN